MEIKYADRMLWRNMAKKEVPIIQMEDNEE